MSDSWLDFRIGGVVLSGRTEQRVPCPRCDRGPRDEALGINVETGAFHCFRCGWKGRAGREQSTPTTAVRRIDDPARAERKRERLRRIWKESLSLTHADAAPVCRYLQSRALGAVLCKPPRVLRAHPNLEYWDDVGRRSLGRFPAMVALYQGADESPITLHATFLRPDGAAKAAVPVPKKTLAVPSRGSTKGGAIRLYPPRDGFLGVAEGIESALSLHLIRAIPVWSARCADNLKHICLPANLGRLEIGVDVDASGKGQQVAEALAERVRRRNPGTQCFLILPQVEGLGDLNDELQGRTDQNGRR